MSTYSLTYDYTLNMSGTAEGRLLHRITCVVCNHESSVLSKTVAEITHPFYQQFMFHAARSIKQKQEAKITLHENASHSPHAIRRRQPRMMDATYVTVDPWHHYLHCHIYKRISGSSV
jgi:hypothetical protein